MSPVPRALLRPRVVDLVGLRVAGGVMLVAAGMRTLLPGHPGLPCPLRALTGVPCPFCGMTTSVDEAVHLHGATALAANPGGLVAVCLAVILLAAGRARRLAVPAWLPVLATGLMWLFELHRFRVL